MTFSSDIVDTLTCYSDIRSVVVHRTEQPDLAAEYTVICNLKRNADVVECERLVKITLKMLLGPKSRRIRYIICESGPVGKLREVVWRLGGNVGEVLTLSIWGDQPKLNGWER